MRVVALILGILLLLPGLCFLGFGAIFAGGMGGSGLEPFALAELAIGVLITAGAVALIRSFWK